MSGGGRGASFRVMAGHQPPLDRAQFGADLPAFAVGQRATGMKGAAGRRIERRGQFAG